ncbi:putative iron reductase domain protein [Zalerion maritima]|uniref:Iron reductase domain protein n=1 Tax=Zalerion maritima TaxID=339359 RepID=A0AAD5RYY4_9PEZI|nr:putative iron reductase domain protein [Zalerion maritima]
MAPLSTPLFLLLGTSTVAFAGPTVARQETRGQYYDETTGLCYSEYSIAQLGITYRLATPESAEGDFDLALLIVATNEVDWAGMAWGEQMAGNPITIGWRDGEEAAESSRWATAHAMPDLYREAPCTVRPGSGANETHWTLSVLCSECTSWESGSVDASGSVAKGGWEHDMAASGNAEFDALVEAAMAIGDPKGGAGDGDERFVPEEPPMGGPMFE